MISLAVTLHSMAIVLGYVVALIGDVKHRSSWVFVGGFTAGWNGYAIASKMGWI